VRERGGVADTTRAPQASDSSTLCPKELEAAPHGCCGRGLSFRACRRAGLLSGTLRGAETR
jgi:hypothetical protein